MKPRVDGGGGLVDAFYKQEVTQVPALKMKMET